MSPDLVPLVVWGSLFVVLVASACVSVIRADRRARRRARRAPASPDPRPVLSPDEEQVWDVIVAHYDGGQAGRGR